MAPKTVSPKKKVVVRKIGSPKVVERKQVAKKVASPKVADRKISVYKKVQTAEGWKRSMAKLRKANLAKPVRKS